MNAYVHSITHEADGIASFALRPLGGALAAIEPGAHVDVTLPNGLTRQYSLINAIGETNAYRIAVKRDPKSRGGSHFMHDALRVGTPLAVSEPRNNFPLHETAEHSIFIAGGIGVTPIVTMIERLRDRGRSASLVYAVRAARDVAFRDRLLAAAEIAHVHVEDPARVVVDVAAHLRDVPARTHVYCCGPAPMLDAFIAATATRDPATVHFERFAAEALEPRRGAFTVELARSHTTIDVLDGESILSALRNAGIPTVSSCEEGVCGTCETAVLAGIPDHRDAVLSAADRAANMTMMICCSGSHSSRLTLDL
jgi:ferredoxin-NADP reductase